MLLRGKVNGTEYPISFARLLLQVSLSLEHGHLAMELIKLCRFLRGFLAGLSFQV
jgi:hypothetical protein